MSKTETNLACLWNLLVKISGFWTPGNGTHKPIAKS